MVAFCSTVQKFHCFALEVSTVNTVSRFYSRICIAIQQKEIKILYINIATWLAS